MKHTLSILILFALAAMASGQTNVQMVGSSVGATGKHIGLYAYDNMLCMNEVVMDEAVIDSIGHFELRCYVNYPRLVVVQVENYSQSFYVEPGRNYKVFIPEFDWSQDEQHNVHLDPVALPLEFLGVQDDELNVRIGEFERVADSFVVANRVFFDPKFKRDARRMDTLRALIYRREPKGDPETFYERYREYTLAQMALAMGMANRKKLIARYITDQPIRYHDEQFMRLFFSLYEGSISHGTRRVPARRLAAWIAAEDVSTFLDSIGLDPLLRNERVRELAALQALRECYYANANLREHIANMVKAIGKGSKFEEHKTLVAAMSKEWPVAGDVAPVEGIELPDVERNMVSLNSWRGKWVYMAFVRADDPNSIAELETMAHFRDSVYARNNNVEFVSVCCDREFQKMYHLLKNSRRGKRYNWTWLHYDGNYRLLEHFGVVSYPTFVILAPDGSIRNDYAPAPATGILLNGPWEKKKVEESRTKLPFAE